MIPRPEDRPLARGGDRAADGAPADLRGDRRNGGLPAPGVARGLPRRSSSRRTLGLWLITVFLDVLDDGTCSPTPCGRRRRSSPVPSSSRSYAGSCTARCGRSCRAMSAWFTKRACAVAFAVCVGSALVPTWAQGEDAESGYNADQSGAAQPNSASPGATGLRPPSKISMPKAGSLAAHRCRGPRRPGRAAEIDPEYERADRQRGCRGGHRADKLGQCHGLAAHPAARAVR